MRLRQLTLRNFRNVSESRFEPGPGLNFLIGQNGQGKTSFLEAISYLSLLRSFRGAKSAEVIRWGEAQAEVSARLVDDSGELQTDLAVRFVQEGERTTKTASINGKAHRSSTSYLTQRFGHFELGFHSIIFNPADHDLVRGEPSLRRAYLDRVIAAEDLDYFKVLTRYQKTLDQRNALLKQEPGPSRELLNGFTEPLVVLGSELTLKRLQWLERLSQRLDNMAHKIAPNQPRLEVIYQSRWVTQVNETKWQNTDYGTHHFSGQDPLPSLELLEQQFWKQLSLVAPTELRLQQSLVGPHRDDWAFELGGNLLKGHGSQGEVRSALLALKLCELELFLERTGHRPLFLLDDFSSELDRERRSFLLEHLMTSGLQILVTTTESLVKAERVFHVSGGGVSAQDRATKVDRTDDKPGE